MTRDAIQHRVKRILGQRLGKAAELIHPGDQLVADLRADSLDAIEVVFELEDEFAITIDDDTASRMLTVEDVVNHVEQALKRREEAE